MIKEACNTSIKLENVVLALLDKIFKGDKL